MNVCRKMIALVPAFSVLGLYFPKTSFAAQGYLFAKAMGITEHSQEILALPEEKIPVEEVAKKKRSKWWWVPGVHC